MKKNKNNEQTWLLPDWNCCDSISSRGGTGSSYLATACLPDPGIDASTEKVKISNGFNYYFINNLKLETIVKFIPSR